MLNSMNTKVILQKSIDGIATNKRANIFQYLSGNEISQIASHILFVDFELFGLTSCSPT
jgi:hypothetical protein